MDKKPKTWKEKFEELDAGTILLFICYMSLAVPTGISLLILTIWKLFN